MKNNILLLTLLMIVHFTYSQINSECVSEKIKAYVASVMEEGEIPGLSYVIINGKHAEIENFGYSNVKTKEKITSKTLYELGTTSKAFTALALLKLEKEGKVNLDDKVSDYLKWFHVKYNDDLVEITLCQLIHQTSGIPWRTIGLIPQSDNDKALEEIIKKINGFELHHIPGKQFESADINYDLLALITEKVTGHSFEAYVNNMFKELELESTTIGKTKQDLLSKGYKIGFFKPREFDAPVYRGNNAAAYVNSNAEDLTKWMKYQMGVLPCNYDTLITISHQKDETVMPNNLSSYAYGWNVSLLGNGEIYHNGLNPNFSSYIAFRKKEGIGVCILANSNSSYTKIMGKNIMNILTEEKVSYSYIPDNSNDKAFSVVSIILIIYLLFVLGFLTYIIIGILKGIRRYKSLTLKKLGNVFLAFIIILPFLYGIYLLPKAMAGFTWETTIVWAPISFPFLLVLCLSSIGLSYFTCILTVIFPEKNEYKRNAPKIILLSILSGISNMVLIILITSSLNSAIEIKYLLYYFGLTLFVYILSSKIVQTKMIYLTRNAIYDLRMKLINKVFSTSYEKFEKIDRGRIYTTMNDDIGTIGQSANTFVSVTTSLFTAGAAFLYMATLAFEATLVTILLIGSISTLYYFVSRRTKVLFDDARETRTVYMRLLNGMIDGFKELSISG